jgi:hypothetical protein
VKHIFARIASDTHLFTFVSAISRFSRSFAGDGCAFESNRHRGNELGQLRMADTSRVRCDDEGFRGTSGTFSHDGSFRASFRDYSDHFPMHSHRSAPHLVDTGTSELSSDHGMRLAARYGTSLVRKMFPQ